MFQKKSLLLLMILIAGLIICSYSYADYPLLKTVTYSADPSCLEYNGVIYSYWSNDDNNNGGYQMHQITCLSSSDLKNWTNHGQVFDVPGDCSWASNSWAPAVVYRGGYFWMYFGNGGSGIGVAKSTSPTGPFKDAKGSVLINGSTPGATGLQWCFDPGVFVDDDGQAYIYWGGGDNGTNARVAKLNNDMISLNGSAVSIPAPNHFEDSWIHKYNGKYYYSYSSNPSTGMKINYLMSDNPMTGWVNKGTVMNNPPDNSGNNNHHSIFQFKGNWYIGYHNRYTAIQQGVNTTYKRNACMDQLFYNSDGTMKLVTCTRNGLPQLTSGPTPPPTPTPTPVITPTPNQNPVWSGGPYTLNGTSDYVDLPDGLTNSLYDFSVACWVKLNSLNNWSRIFDFGGDTNVFMMLTPSSGSTGYPNFAITTSGNSGEQGIDGTSALATGSWQHLAVVKNGNTGILYINKQEVGRNTGMTLRPADLGNTTNNYIGRSQWSNDPYLNADVDKFYVYNRALSAAEVTTLGNDPPGGNVSQGDVNGSGTVDILDALMTAQYAVGLAPAGFIAANADVNCDSTINIVDALMIAQYYVGLITKFSC